ncbi:hypothetical protein GH733_017358, partial [Mirounga leonina]
MHLLLNIFIALYVTGPKKRNTSMEKAYEYCNSSIPNKSVVLLHAVMFPFVDLVSASWPGLAQAESPTHHSNNLFPRPSHEARATRTILVL